MTKDESIRADLLLGMTYSQIERKHHVNSKTITEIKREMILDGIDLPENKFSPTKRKGSGMYTKQEKEELIKQAILNGKTYMQIIIDYDVCSSTISGIKRKMRDKGIEMPKNKYSGWQPNCGRKPKPKPVREPLSRSVGWVPSKLIEYKPKRKAQLVKDDYGTRCENCRSKVEQCRNCYSLDLIGRLPKAEEFNLIESKTAI